MTAQVWVRNPINYIREVVEVRHQYVVWDQGFLVKRNLDPLRFCELNYPSGMFFRMLIVGNTEQGCRDIPRGGDLRKPAAVYPVWEYGESINLLEDLMENPAGECVEECNDKDVPREKRPVLGQEHRVVITGIPSVGTGLGRKFIHTLHDLQLSYPDCIVHVHALYSFRIMFGLSFRSVDIDARTNPANGRVTLPNGKKVTPEIAAAHPQWVTICGFNPVDLKIPRNRCMFEIKSAKWAAANYGENLKFKSTPVKSPDTSSSNDEYTVPVLADTGGYTNLTAQPGDKIACDSCTLQKDCKYFRDGSVCSVPDSETSKLADFFNTRDSNVIIQGLGALLGAQADRLEKGMEDEKFSEEMDPEVTKMINSLFANGVKLAKLTNPELAGGTKVGVFVNGGSGAGASVAVGNSASQLTAAIVNELEAKGIQRSDITPEMIGRVLAGDPKTQPAIDAKAITTRE